LLKPVPPVWWRDIIWCIWSMAMFNRLDITKPLDYKSMMLRRSSFTNPVSKKGKFIIVCDHEAYVLVLCIIWVSRSTSHLCFILITTPSDHELKRTFSFSWVKLP
jgi:hypothetical protein